MQDRVNFEYAIIRVVPQVEREEFINIGAVLYARQKKYLGIRYHIDKKRLAAFSDKIDIDLIEKYLKAWKLVCEGGAQGGNIGQLEIQVRFRWLTANRSTIIQASNLHTGLSSDPEKMLTDIYERYVL